jgi:hypothetical protein
MLMVILYDDDMLFLFLKNVQHSIHCISLPQDNVWMIIYNSSGRYLEVETCFSLCVSVNYINTTIVKLFLKIFDINYALVIHPLGNKE